MLHSGGGFAQGQADEETERRHHAEQDQRGVQPVMVGDRAEHWREQAAHRHREAERHARRQSDPIGQILLPHHDHHARARGHRDTLTLQHDTFELKSATVGVPMPHGEVKIIDPATGMPVPCGSRGELCCRGYLVMDGYYNMPEKTADAIDSEGWLHSGDLATMNAHGYVNIVGRLKEMIIRGGENIFPREVEEFLIRHPRVADAQIVGVPDKFCGEELLAVIIPNEGDQLTGDELREYCKGQISHQKIPRYFQFVAAYPLTGSG